MLEVSDLSVSYGATLAVNKISFSVAENEIVCLIGANGAGKSSCLAAIMGLVDYDGEIFFKGGNISNSATDKIVKKGISLIPEGRLIFPKLTVEENLIVGKSSVKGMHKNQLQERIEMQYQLFPRLKERRKQAGGTLSGGEQQMLAIARGMMSDPTLVMLDEPTLGLAPIIIEEIFELILKIQALNKTVLLVEQNANMALSVCDRAYVMERGALTLSGYGEDLLENPEVQKAYLGI